MQLHLITTSDVPLKRCPQCGVEKPATAENFYFQRTKSGNLSPTECKSCKRAYYAANRDRIRVRNQRFYAASAEHQREEARAYYSKKKAERTDYILEYRRRHPARVRAREAVKRALRWGELPPIRTCSCFMCGKRATDFHHVDYEKPLDVFAMCRSCHKLWHVANDVETFSGERGIRHEQPES